MCKQKLYLYKTLIQKKGGARGVMVIVAEYGHDDTSSNPGHDWLHSTNTLGKV